MYYDDEARRFNFISGLLLGAILGTGIGLLATPAMPKKTPTHLRDGAGSLRDGAVRASNRARDESERGLRAMADRIAR